jgi:ABC-type nitrate/sulfonate/bicarbonate transport system permease component
MLPLAVGDDLHEAVDAARSARRLRRRRDALILNTARIAVLVAALLAWHLASLATSPLILPSPASVAVQLVQNWGIIVTSLWVTLAEIGLGFAAGSTIGVVAGTAIAHLAGWTASCARTSPRPRRCQGRAGAAFVLRLVRSTR